MGENLKIFLCETRRPRPLIFGMYNVASSKPYFIWSVCFVKLIKAKFYIKLLLDSETKGTFVLQLVPATIPICFGLQNCYHKLNSEIIVQVSYRTIDPLIIIIITISSTTTTPTTHFFAQKKNLNECSQSNDWQHWWVNCLSVGWENGPGFRLKTISFCLLFPIM